MASINNIPKSFLLIMLISEVVLFAGGFMVGRMTADQPVGDNPTAMGMVSRAEMDAALSRAEEAEKRAEAAEKKLETGSRATAEPEVAHRESDEVAAARAETAVAKQEADRAKEALLNANMELEARNTQLKELGDQVAALEAEITALSDTGTMMIRWGKWKDMRAVLQADFAEAGAAANRMMEPLQDLARELEAGKSLNELGPEVLQQIGAENNRLIELATRLEKSIPSHSITVNGQFTHPLVQFNLIAQSLEAAGIPLSERQREQLAALAEGYDENWETKQAYYDESTYRLQKLADELEAKISIRAQVEGVLTQQQLNAIVVPGTSDLVGFDLYSPSLMMMGIVQPAAGMTAEAIRSTVLEGAKRNLGLGEGADSAVEVAVDAFLQQTKPLHTMPLPALKAYGSYSPTEALMALRAQLHMYRTLETSLRPGEELLTKWRGSVAVVLPRLLKAE